MASYFPPNLDDGELWLPPEIIPDVGARRLHHRHVEAERRAGSRPDLRCIEDLAQKLAAFGLLDRNHPFAPLEPGREPPGLPSARPASRFVPPESAPAPPSGIAYDGFKPREGRGVGPGAGNAVYSPSGRRPIHGFNSGKPVQMQVDPFGQGRARVLQSYGSNPPLRFSVSQSRCGGTGVFLPRVPMHSNGKKKPSSKGAEQQEHQPSRSIVDERKQRMVPLQPLSELGLPQDWTY